MVPWMQRRSSCHKGSLATVLYNTESISKDRSRAYCVRSSVHLAMASTVEAQTAEEAKSFSKSELCDRKLVI